MARHLGMALLVVGSFACSEAWADVILHVDDSITVPGNGLTWATGMNDLQAALTAAAVLGSGVTEIRVAQGLYEPTLRVDPNDPRSVTFRLLSGVTMRGGYAGPSESDPDAWDPDTFVSTLSGDLAGDDLPGAPAGPENALHVMLFDAPSGAATIAGFRVVAGNANIDNIETFTHFGGGLLVVGAQVSVDNCTFAGNTGLNGGGAYIRGGGASFDHCDFIQNVGTNRGGAIRWYQASSSSMSNCTFEGNSTTPNSPTGGGALAVYDTAVSIITCAFNANTSDGGGAIAVTNGGPGTVVQGSSFTWNRAAVGGAIATGSPIEIKSCQFSHNQADLSGGAVSANQAPVVISRCLFEHNSVAAGSFFAGAIMLGGQLTNATVSDCLIVNNSAGRGGGIFVAKNATLRNCTIVNNDHDGVTLGPNGQLNAVNCVIWGNSPDQIAIDDGNPPPPPSFLPSILVSYSNIQGGWAGDGNMNLDPQMIQPGCGNTRLGPDSPCINAGSNAALPPGTLLDLDGQPRIQNGVVDMGAYEGPHAPLPLVACASDIWAGDIINLVPAGGTLAPMDRPGVRLLALDGEGASAQLEQTTTQLHVGVGGYWEIAEILTLNSTLPEAGHRSRFTIPFDASDLGLLDYNDIDVTFFDPASGRWTLAVANNIHNSPGYSGPVGDRIVIVGTDANYGMTLEFGDHGVFWNPALQRGFAWANIDRHGEFAIGAALGLCPTDCAQPPDSVVDHLDLLTVINAWGEGVAGLPADIDATFAVDINDLLTVINGWGPCR